MKIAYLANVRFPSERAHAAQIAHMCQAFAQNGAEVDLIVNTRGKGQKTEVDQYFKIDSRFSVKRIPYGIFAPSIKTSFYVSECIFAFSFLLKSKVYDIVYSRGEWIILIVSLFLPAKRLLWESHEAKLNFPARKILQKGIKVVVISEGIEEAYLKYGVPAKQLLVAHDGIDESFFAEIESKAQARVRLGLPQDKQVAMYIGGFDSWKGVETFFAASKDCREILFVAIGGSASQIDGYQAAYPKVLFLGARSYSELKDNQQAADILVIPNSATTALSEKYTSPLKLFAHMASGIPIVASDISSITNVTGRDLVTLFQADETTRLSTAIIEVLADYNSNKLQAQALKEVAISYTWTKRAANIITFINSN